MPRQVFVRSPSRLHFGLWSLTREAGRQFGGVGAMIAEPALHLVVTEADQFHTRGKLCQRTQEYARRWAAFQRCEIPPCCIDIERSIPEHAGLGSGTQLGLAVAAALNAFSGLPSASPEELALSVNRGVRSAVGTYGFVFGGLIVEQGKLPTDPISPLDCRIDLPADWRFVLVRQSGLTGLAGEAEAAAFEALGQFPADITQRLIAIVRERLVPAAATTDFGLFGDSLYEYGRLSGQCFASRQGGPYNGPIVTAIIERIRQLGGVGVGQSSWGPTVFVAVDSQAAAEQLVSRLTSPLGLQRSLAGRSEDVEIVIAKPANHGAEILVHEKSGEPS